MPPNVLYKEPPLQSSALLLSTNPSCPPVPRPVSSIQKLFVRAVVSPRPDSTSAELRRRGPFGDEEHSCTKDFLDDDDEKAFKDPTPPSRFADYSIIDGTTVAGILSNTSHRCIGACYNVKGRIPRSRSRTQNARKALDIESEPSQT